MNKKTTSKKLTAILILITIVVNMCLVHLDTFIAKAAETSHTFSGDSSTWYYDNSTGICRRQDVVMTETYYKNKANDYYDDLLTQMYADGLTGYHKFKYGTGTTLVSANQATTSSPKQWQCAGFVSNVIYHSFKNLGLVTDFTASNLTNSPAALKTYMDNSNQWTKVTSFKATPTSHTVSGSTYSSTSFYSVQLAANQAYADLVTKMNNGTIKAGDIILFQKLDGTWGHAGIIAHPSQSWYYDNSYYLRNEISDSDGYPALIGTKPFGNSNAYAGPSGTGKTVTIISVPGGSSKEWSDGSQNGTPAYVGAVSWFDALASGTSVATTNSYAIYRPTAVEDHDEYIAMPDLEKVQDGTTTKVGGAVYALISSSANNSTMGFAIASILNNTKPTSAADAIHAVLNGLGDNRSNILGLATTTTSGASKFYSWGTSTSGGTTRYVTNSYGVGIYTGSSSSATANVKLLEIYAPNGYSRDDTIYTVSLKSSYKITTTGSTHTAGTKYTNNNASTCNTILSQTAITNISPGIDNGGQLSRITSGKGNLRHEEPGVNAKWKMEFHKVDENGTYVSGAKISYSYLGSQLSTTRNAAVAYAVSQARGTKSSTWGEFTTDTTQFHNRYGNDTNWTSTSVVDGQSYYRARIWYETEVPDNFDGHKDVFILAVARSIAGENPTSTVTYYYYPHNTNDLSTLPTTINGGWTEITATSPTNAPYGLYLDDGDVSGIKSVYLTNTRQPGKETAALEFHKVNEKGELVAGANFTYSFLSGGYTTKNGAINKAVQSLRTGNSGTDWATFTTNTTQSHNCYGTANTNWLWTNKKAGNTYYHARIYFENYAPAHHEGNTNVFVLALSECIAVPLTAADPPATVKYYYYAGDTSDLDSLPTTLDGWTQITATSPIGAPYGLYIDDGIYTDAVAVYMTNEQYGKYSAKLEFHKVDQDGNYLPGAKIRYSSLTGKWTTANGAVNRAVEFVNNSNTFTVTTNDVQSANAYGNAGTSWSESGPDIVVGQKYYRARIYYEESAPTGYDGHGNIVILALSECTAIYEGSSAEPSPVTTYYYCIHDTSADADMSDLPTTLSGWTKIPSSATSPATAVNGLYVNSGDVCNAVYLTNTEKVSVDAKLRFHKVNQNGDYVSGATIKYTAMTGNKSTEAAALSDAVSRAGSSDTTLLFTLTTNSTQTGNAYGVTWTTNDVPIGTTYYRARIYYETDVPENYTGHKNVFILAMTKVVAGKPSTSETTYYYYPHSTSDPTGISSDLSKWTKITNTTANSYGLYVGTDSGVNAVYLTNTKLAKITHQLAFHKVDEDGQFLDGATIKYSTLTGPEESIEDALSASLSNIQGTNWSTEVTNTSQNTNPYGDIWTRDNMIEGKTYYRARIYNETEFPNNYAGVTNLYIFAISKCVSNDNPTSTVEYYCCVRTSINDLPDDINKWTKVTATTKENAQYGLYLQGSGATLALYEKNISISGSAVHKLEIHKVDDNGNYIEGATLQYTALTANCTSADEAVSTSVSRIKNSLITVTTDTTQTGNAYGDIWNTPNATMGQTLWRARIYHESVPPVHYDGNTDVYILAISSCEVGSTNPTIEYYYSTNSLANLPTTLSGWTKITANSASNNQNGLYVAAGQSVNAVYIINTPKVGGFRLFKTFEDVQSSASTNSNNTLVKTFVRTYAKSLVGNTPQDKFAIYAVYDVDPVTNSSHPVRAWLLCNETNTSVLYNYYDGKWSPNHTNYMANIPEDTVLYVREIYTQSGYVFKLSYDDGDNKTVRGVVPVKIKADKCITFTINGVREDTVNTNGSLTTGSTTSSGTYNTETDVENVRKLTDNIPETVTVSATKRNENNVIDPKMKGAVLYLYYNAENEPNIQVTTTNGDLKNNIGLWNGTDYSGSATNTNLNNCSGTVLMGIFTVNAQGIAIPTTVNTISNGSSSYKGVINGETIEKLPVGYYTLVEYSAPSNGQYSVTTDIDTKEIFGNDSVKNVFSYSVENNLLTATGSTKVGNEVLTTAFILSDAVRIQIPFYKSYDSVTDGTNTAKQMYEIIPRLYKREGAKFNVRLNNENGVIVATGITDANSNVTLTTTSAANTYGITLDDVDKNTLWVAIGTNLYYEEINVSSTAESNGIDQSNEGYELNHEGILISYDGTPKSATISNNPVLGELSINKYLAGEEVDLSLFNGAEFEVYYTSYAGGNLKTGLQIDTDTNNFTRTVTIKDETSTNSTSGAGLAYSTIIHKMGTFKIQNGQIIAEAETMTFTDVDGNPTYKCTVDGDKLTNVPLGKYVIIETKAPNAINIGLSEIEYYAFETAYPKSGNYSSSNTIAATYSDSTSFQTLYNVDEDFSLRIGINEIEYIPYNLTKTYATVKDKKFYELFPERYELNDTVFKVYIRTGATSTSDHIIANGITDDNGEAVFTLTSYAIEYGYFLSEDNKTIYRPKSTTVLRSEETQSSKGYTRDTSTQTGINSTEHINTPKTVEVHLNKILIGTNGSTIANAIADGKLNGAVFTLYYTPENEEYLNTNLTTNLTNSNRNQTVAIANGKTIYTVGTFTITNGKIVALASSFESHDIEYTASVNNDTNGYFYDLPLGSYALVETTAPTDITISLEEGISTHEFTDTTTTFNYTFTKSDSQITDVYITLKKESNDTSVTNNNSLYSLANAEYSVYWNESTEVTTTVNNGVVTVGNGIYRGKFKIDSNGNGYVIENLWSDDQTVPAAYNTATQIGTTELTQFYGKPGYYAVVETKLADSGYDWDNTPRKSGLLTVNGTKMKSLTSKETPITVPVNINIVKKNLKDNTVVAQTGTQVTAQFYAGATEESQLTSITKTMVFETKSTGIIDISDSSYLKSGSLYSDNKYPAGILVLTETQAPVDYDLVGLQWEIENTLVNKMVFRISINGNTGKIEYLDNSNAWVDVTSDVTLNYLSTTVKDKKHDYYGDFNFTKYKFQDKTGMANVSFKVVMIKDESGIDLTATEQINNTYTFVTSADGTYNSQTMNLYKNNVLVPVQEDGHKLINGTYELYEVSCDANNGYEVPSTKLDTFTINKTNTTISLGSYYNYKPEMHTVEWANDTHTHFTATSETTKIIDTVTLKDVKAGNYYLVGILVDTETKKPLTAYNSNSIITAKRAITVTADSGFDRAVEASFDVEFPTFDTRTLDGKSFTVFEYLFEADGTIAGTLSTKDGVWTTENHANKTDLYLTNNNVNTYALLSHANPGDTTQTGTLEGIIGTTVQSSKLVYAGPNQTIVDRVYYKGMDTSKRYILVAQLMGKNDDNEIVTYATSISDIFTITNKDDIKDIEIIFDASNAKGKSFTCYEYMYQIIDDTVQNKSEFNANDTTKFYLAGHHTVFGDENQTVQVPNVWTQVTESKKIVSEITSITDTVYYSNVIASRTYTIRAELVDKNGNLVEITSTPISFVADSTSGSKNITFTFNSQPWAGESLVVYEYLYEGNAVDASKLIGDHTDLTDSKQTIEFTNLQLKFNKTDFNDVILKGAKFELRYSDGTLVDSWESNGTSDHVSYVTSYGKYTLTEVYSPNGYALSDSIEIELRESDGKLYINGIAQNSVDTNIIDKDAALTFLPSAGGIGTTPYIIIGLLLMSIAIVFKKKKYYI